MLLGAGIPCQVFLVLHAAPGHKKGQSTQENSALGICSRLALSSTLFICDAGVQVRLPEGGR